MTQTVQAFGVRREQVAAWREPILETLNHPLLNLMIEIDQRVAAEDEIERPPRRRRIEEVQLPELDERSDPLRDLDRPLRERGAPVEIFQDEVTRHGGDALGLVDAGLGAG